MVFRSSPADMQEQVPHDAATGWDEALVMASYGKRKLPSDTCWFPKFCLMGFVGFSFRRQEQVWYDADAGWDEVLGVALQQKRN